MAKLKSPLVAIREERGLTRKEFAQMSGLSYHRLYLVEAAYTASIPKKVLVALESLGCDSEAIGQANKEFFAEMGREVRAKVLKNG